jgi:hypothetical protein
MERYYISKEDFQKFLLDLNKKIKCFIPQRTAKNDYVLTPFSGEEAPEFVFNEYRSIDPLKTYLTYAKEEVAQYFSTKESPESSKPICLVGVKSCDLFSLKIQDFVFNVRPGL